MGKANLKCYHNGDITKIKQAEGTLHQTSTACTNTNYYVCLRYFFIKLYSHCIANAEIDLCDNKTMNIPDENNLSSGVNKRYKIINNVLFLTRNKQDYWKGRLSLVMYKECS